VHFQNVVVVRVVCNLTGCNGLGLFVVLVLDFSRTLQLVRSFLTYQKTKNKTETLFPAMARFSDNLAFYHF
jgi:hypothetical protein